MTPRRRDLTLKTYDDCENVLLRESPLMSNISLKLKCLVLLTLPLQGHKAWKRALEMFRVTVDTFLLF